jgi:hypothetical protein
MSGSVTLVRRELLSEAWAAVTRFLLRHDRPGGACGEREEDAVGFAFANALPSHAVLFDVSHVRFFWCAQPIVASALVPRSRAAGRCAGSHVARRALRWAWPSPRGCCSTCTSSACDTWCVRAFEN